MDAYTFDITQYNSYMKFFSQFGTALFVCSIGISTGGILDFRNRKDIRAIFIGALMSLSSFAAMKIISLYDCNITVSELLGVLCGALTTTPGLSAACELNNIAVNDVILGYGCTYIFGVTATVLFVQIAGNRVDYISKKDNNEFSDACTSHCALYGLIQIGCAVVFGSALGNIKNMNFSLGTSGGMLCLGIIIGIIVKKFFPKRVLTTKMSMPFRNMGLVLFFVGNGISAGMQISGGVNIKMFVYGALLTLIPITVGMILCKLLFNDKLSAVTIAGGMTSTPAICVLIGKYDNIPLCRYALSYFGALITGIILIRI